MNYSQISEISGVAVITISDKKYDRWMSSLHKYAESALNFYIGKFGFYPFSYLLVLSGEKDCAGGYPQNAGVLVIHKKAISLSHRKESWQWIVAHEIGHMYWGYYVRDKNPRKESNLGWVTKGLGLYWDRQFVTESGIEINIHNDMVASWEIAKYRRKPTSFVLKKGEKLPKGYDYNWTVDHGRAYFVMSDVAEQITPEKFYELCNLLLKNYAGKKVSFATILRIIRNKYSQHFRYKIN